MGPKWAPEGLQLQDLLVVCCPCLGPSWALLGQSWAFLGLFRVVQEGILRRILGLDDLIGDALRQKLRCQKQP